MRPRQGFWNASLRPIGYRIVEAAEQHGHRTKKTLEVDPVQAETVRLIFRLSREGDGSSGPTGVKSITKHLNAAGIRTRDGGRWGLGTVHKVLTRTNYVGRQTSQLIRFIYLSIGLTRSKHTQIESMYNNVIVRFDLPCRHRVGAEAVPPQGAVTRTVFTKSRGSSIMRKYNEILAALGIVLVSMFGYSAASKAQQNAVTAIDIALEPDATMIQHAHADNARLLKAFPKGFALDATHHAHVTMLQQFVRTADLDKVYAAANKVLASEKPTTWKLKAFKYYYIPSPPVGLAGIVVEPTEDLLRFQQKLIDAVEPFTTKTGTAAAFMSTEEGRDIQQSLIEYVADFVTIAAGKKFNPHVTIGVGSEAYLNEMLAEPFQAFTFSPASASVYQLGSFGTARKELKALELTH